MSDKSAQPTGDRSNTRREFLRRALGIRSTPTATPIRPPWAHDERAFDAACSGCGDCVDACPEQILHFDQHQRPVVDFARGACTFCGRCVDSCAEPAFVDRNTLPPWDWEAVVSPDCLTHQQVTCRSCGDACEPNAIRFRLQAGQTARPELDSDTCNGCGACVGVCPTTAISLRHSGSVHG